MTVKKGNITWGAMLLVPIAAVLVFVGNIFAQAPAGSPVALHGQLSVKGGQIVDKNDEPFQLRGMSFFWSTVGWGGDVFYNANVVNWLADDWKVNVVRASMDPGSRGDWEKVVSAAVAKGIYVVIDWHSHNATQQQSDAVSFFTTVSNTYKNTPNVIYEIYNEPCPSGEQSGKCLGESWATIKTYAQAVVNAIRNNDKNNIIVIGTEDYSKRVDNASLNPVSGTNLVYTVHYYTAQEGTQHQGTLRGWCSQALSRGVALLVTEFGLSEADGGQKKPTVIDTAEANVWFDYLDINQIGWMNWSIHTKNEAASALTSGASTSGNWTDGNLSPSGRFIRNKLRLYGNSAYTFTLDKVGDGAVAKTPDKQTYTLGVPVTVTATPASGWAFAGFEGGDLSSTQRGTSPVVISMKANKSVKAVFEDAKNIVKNGTFTVSTESWATNNSTSLSLTQDNYQLKAAVSVAGAAGDLRVTQSGIKLEKGKKYELSFNARGQSARSITPRITNNTSTRDYIGNTPISLTPSMQPYSVPFTSDTTITNAILRFDCGDAAVAWFMDDVKLLDKGPGTAVAPRQSVPQRTAWSVSNTGGVVRLRGPIEPGSRVTLYDTRGKVVRRLAAVDGMSLSVAGVGAGSYILAVRSVGGAEVFRARVTSVR